MALKKPKIDPNEEISIDLKIPHNSQKKFIYSEKKRNIICAGRRSGKTTGISILASIKFLEGFKVLYIAPTYDQTETFWIEVANALEKPIEKKIFIKNEKTKNIGAKWFSGKITAKTGWSGDTLRGLGADILILDEYQMMSEDIWNTVAAPMLLDSGGTCYLVYTPPSIRSIGGSRAKDPRHASKLFINKKNDPRWNVFSFTSFDNPSLDKQALSEISEDMTQLSYRQEILAENINEVPGALWSRDLLEKTRVDSSPELSNKIIAVDPSTTEEGDEWGIIICGNSDNNHYYVLKDYSASYTPGEAAKKIVHIYFEEECDKIIYESNQGGDMVKDLIRSFNKNVPIKSVHASRGKRTRAEPIAAFFENNKCHLVDHFFILEDELCTTTFISGNSPNRLDAMVWGISYLSNKENNTISTKTIKGLM